MLQGRISPEEFAAAMCEINTTTRRNAPSAAYYTLVIALGTIPVVAFTCVLVIFAVRASVHICFRARTHPPVAHSRKIHSSGSG